VRRCRVHCIPPRVRDDREPPLLGRDGGDMQLICARRKPIYFCKWGWTGNWTMSPSGKSPPESWLLRKRLRHSLRDHAVIHGFGGCAFRWYSARGEARCIFSTIRVHIAPGCGQCGFTSAAMHSRGILKEGPLLTPTAHTCASPWRVRVGGRGGCPGRRSVLARGIVAANFAFRPLLAVVLASRAMRTHSRARIFQVA
jgi:hypothetical protein